MAEDGLTYLHKHHSEGEDKYTYFLLSVSAAAVAFSVQKTETSIVTWTLVPMALAVLSWGLSFYYGCKNLIWGLAATSMNYHLLLLVNGIHSEQPSHPQFLEAAMRVTNRNLASNIEKAASCAKWQFRWLLLGAVFFLIWHIIGILVRTYTHIPICAWFLASEGATYIRV